MDATLPGFGTIISAATEIAASSALHASDRLNGVCSFVTWGYLSKETLDAHAPAHLHAVVTQSGMLGQSAAFVGPYLQTALTELSGELGWAFVRQESFPGLVADQIRVAGGDGYLGRALGWTAKSVLSSNLMQGWARDATCSPPAVIAASLTTLAMSAPDRALSMTDMLSLQNTVNPLASLGSDAPLQVSAPALPDIPSRWAPNPSEYLLMPAREDKSLCDLPAQPSIVSDTSESRPAMSDTPEGEPAALLDKMPVG
ncbi:hypothetical protein JOE11_000938 [Robbsia andropogonis]|uniref:hypothetical protein n=1 Tax=Robbsia andropogonis TaxID=28092 RepID=UPI003D214255